MSTNFKEAAGIVNGTQISGAGPMQHSNLLIKGDKVSSAPDGADGGGSYFYKQDYVADLSKKCQSKDFEQVSKLLTNIGANDKASNWLLE